MSAPKRCRFCGRAGRMIDEHACHDRPACQRRTALIGRWIGTRVLRRQDLDGTQWTIRKTPAGFWTLRVQYRDIVANMSPFETSDAAKRHVDDVIASLTAGSLRAYAEARP